MNIKLRMIGNKMDSSKILFNLEKMQLGTRLLVEKFPITRDIGILTVINSFNELENEFQIVVKDSHGKELGKGEVFRLRIMTREKEAIIIYNINKAYFEKKEDFYTIELLNKGNIIDRFDLSCETNIYNIYNNLDDKGTINLSWKLSKEISLMNKHLGRKNMKN